jgi:hypothetical protein
MPSVLTDSNLCELYVPAAWQEVLEELEAFVELEAQIRHDPQHAAADVRARLIQCHDRLVERSAVLLEPQVMADLPADALVRLFARAVLLVVHVKQCIVAEGDVLDTAGSRTLPLYEADFYGDAEKLHLLHERLIERLGLSAAALREIEAQIDRDLEDAQRKQAVVRALREEFGLWAGAENLPRQVHRLFDALYPGVPLVEDEVRLIITSTLVFFCLPFEGQELTTRRFQSLPAEEQRPIREFLERVNKFTQARFANFPAFGFLTPDQLDRGLADRLAARTGLPSETVARELAQAVTILPLDKLEMYVVHDVWGHGWQASMLSFERMYERMARYADPLELGERAVSAQGGGLAFGDCFVYRNKLLELDEPRFRRFVAGELAERLTVALSAVLAELVADVAEFKLLALDPAHRALLPSTSVLELYPSKLDLSLQDVPFYFGQATKVFRLWSKSAARRRATCEALVRRGADPADARAAVERAAEIWEELAETDYAPQLYWEPASDGRVHVNVFTRVALNFLGIHRATLEAYRHLDDLTPASLPLKSYRDLLILGAAVFFEADPPRNLWRVDEFLALHFIPLCRQLDPPV